MNPRLKTSKKWTAFPKEYLTQIKEVFTQGFKDQMTPFNLLIEGRIYKEEILLRVGLHEKGRLFQANFEVSMGHSIKDEDAIDRIHDSIDAAASMMQEYFEFQKNEQEPDFPLMWKEYEFNTKPLFLQFSTVNSDLESQANALLGDTEDKLLVEEEESEDALDVADEKREPDEPVSPTMFGGKSLKKKKSVPIH